MKLSSNKINHISHVLAKGLYKLDDIDFFVTPNEVRLRIKDIITKELRLDDEVDFHTRKAIHARSRRVP